MTLTRYSNAKMQGQYLALSCLDNEYSRLSRPACDLRIAKSPQILWNTEHVTHKMISSMGNNRNLRLPHCCILLRTTIGGAAVDYLRVVTGKIHDF